MWTEFREQLNKWGQAHVPFLFVVDFEQQCPIAWKLEDVDPAEVLFDFNGVTNAHAKTTRDVALQVAESISFREYEKRFNRVVSHMERGDSFLVNLTMKSRINLEGSLRDVFFASRAPYRLWWKNRFVVFSPETFVTTRDRSIYAYPMKGTIDAATPNAHEQILNDRKELAEHVTIVDLIRNDLSEVANVVEVVRFRYVQEVRSRERKLLQVSSEIFGRLRDEYIYKTGDLLTALLPAGSVSGAPKVKTCEIIREAEGEPRGFYTGVCGYFDGENLDSAVMIRFIEESESGFYYRSGGGITAQSDAGREFDEVLKKIYVPVD